MGGRLWRPVMVAMMVVLAGATAASEASATALHEFSKGLPAGSDLGGIAAGPDGNLWFTDGTPAQIGRVTSGGTVSEFSSGLPAGAEPDALTLGPD
jgi:streptogramin lyase